MNDNTNDNTALTSPVEDVEAHKFVMADGPQEDVEAHRLVVMADGPDEDVEGHKFVMADGPEEDVEGHVQPRGDFDR
jgi:hypothetical protein